MNQHTPHPFVTMDDPAPSAADPEVAVDMAANQLRAGVTELMRLRCDPRSSRYVARMEGNLLSSPATLQVLCSELRVTRPK